MEAKLDSGQPAAPATATLFNRAGMAVTALAGGTWQVEKTGTAAAFNAAAESVETYAGDFTLQARSTGASPNGSPATAIRMALRSPEWVQGPVTMLSSSELVSQFLLGIAGERG